MKGNDHDQDPLPKACYTHGHGPPKTFRAARVQNEFAPEKVLNRYEKRFKKREKGSEKRSETRLKNF